MRKWIKLDAKTLEGNHHGPEFTTLRRTWQHAIPPNFQPEVHTKPWITVLHPARWRTAILAPGLTTNAKGPRCD